jgi:hypothetical protein
MSVAAKIVGLCRKAHAIAQFPHLSLTLFGVGRAEICVHFSLRVVPIARASGARSENAVERIEILDGYEIGLAAV